MTLLTEVYRRPLDPGYALVAARGGSRRTRPGVAALAALALVLGIGTAAATLALRQPAGQAEQARKILETQITERDAEAARLDAQAKAIGAEVSALQARALASADSTLREALAAGAVEAGTAPASGRGVRVVLTDAPSADPDTADPDTRVQDSDLQVLVNGLWQAGAEAIAINGERLTATTAIRSAGSAVLVDLVALSSPYTVEALGDPVRLQTGLATSSAGQLLSALRTTYDIGVDTSSQRRLDLPGSGPVTLRHAQVPPDAKLPEPAYDEATSPTAPGVAMSPGRISGGAK
ncbi:DUF881 domain-containing protein [Cellulomonas sp. HZM]|uniref:DUF881 domain-containing protein n=1 Tax=Cellulomonas sp. HZM TaxID=1454010 RepID=UPI001E295F47|nr:DUF881 domain-containing protein [Cellulomonas sp. HZM]